MRDLTNIGSDLVLIQQYNNDREGTDQVNLYNYYRGEQGSLPVMARQSVSEAKKASHTNLHIDFFKDIVELKVGYVGQKIKPTVNLKDNEKLKEVIQDELKRFGRINAIDTLNSDSIRKATVSGKSHRLCYTKDGDFMCKNIPAWEVVYDYEDNPLNSDVAYYFYEEIGITGKTEKRCNVYDKYNVYYYKATDTTKVASQADKPDNRTANYLLDTSYTPKGFQPHGFEEVPIIPIYNNDAAESDCKQAIPIMDVYDEVISDTSAEVKALRMAYLLIYGNLYTGKDANGNAIDINTWMKQTGTMQFAATEDGKKVGSAEFLEKNINDTVIENILNRLRSHIFEVSGSLDLKELATTERVFSIKAQMMRLENTAKASELYMRAGLYKQARLHTYWMRFHDNIPVDEKMIDWEFSRTFPRDLQGEAETIAKLVTAITVEDALKAVGWDNAEDVAARVEDIQGDIEEIENQDIIIEDA